MKKNTKLNKFMAGSVTAALVASVVAPAVSAAENNFQDIVALDAEAQAAINALADAGVVKGYDNGTKFDPWQNVKRGQVALMLTRVAELGLDSKADTDTNFTDVTGDIELVGAVEALVNEEIASGYQDGTFKPYAQISRQHMAKLIVKAFNLELNENVDVNITDLNEATTEMAEYIKILASHGITTQSEFNPQAPVSRYAFTLFLTRAMDAVNTAEIVEVSELETITVKEGGELVMPETVEVTYADDKTGEVAVEWNTEDVDTDVPGEYEVEGTIEGTDLTATVEVVVEAVEPEVVGVEAINATQLEVKFNKAVDAETVFENGEAGEFVIGVLSVKGLEANNGAGVLAGELSKDGKTLVVTAANLLEGRYDVTIEKIESTKGEEVAKFEEMITVEEDTTAPTIVDTEMINASKVKVNFSEPMKSLGNVTFKLADGTDVSSKIQNNFTAGADEVVLTIGDVETNEEITATFIGAKDQNDNLIKPNPATVTFEKAEKDGEAPEVSSITQTGAKEFTVKFTEELLNNPTISVNGIEASVEKDDNDATKYIVTTTAVLDGASTITVEDFTDLSGEVGEKLSKVVTFVKDGVAAKLVSSEVVTDEEDGKEYLEFAFDKNVELASGAKVAGVGTSVKNYVTTEVSSLEAAVSYKDEDNKKVVRVELDAFLGTDDVEAAEYELDLAFTGVSSEAGIAVDTSKVELTRGEDVEVANTEKVTVTSFEQSTDDNNKVLVIFNKEVDGASATDASNYVIDGAEVDSVNLNAVAQDGTQTAVLTLEADSNTFTGERNVSVEGVKAKDSSVEMDKFTAVKSLKENVAPTVKSAELTKTNEITITFSEAVTNETAGTNDFELLIGGEVVEINNAITSAVFTDATEIVVTLEKAVTAEDIEEGLSVQVLETIDVKDDAENKLKEATIKVAE